MDGSGDFFTDGGEFIDSSGGFTSDCGDFVTGGGGTTEPTLADPASQGQPGPSNLYACDPMKADDYWRISPPDPSSDPMEGSVMRGRGNEDERGGDPSSVPNLVEQWDVYFVLAGIAQALASAGRAALSKLFGGKRDAATAVEGVAAEAEGANPVFNIPRVGSGAKMDPEYPIYDAGGNMIREFPPTPQVHGFSDLVDNYAALAQRFPVSNGGTLYQIGGSSNGVAGRFEWIVQNGAVTHRMFVPGGSINGVPISP
jgi:hypothetical protein